VADPEVLSVHEAADIMGVSMQRVRQMISAGQIAARRSSAGWLIPAGAVADRPGSLHQGRPSAPRTVWSALALLAAASDLAAGSAGDGDMSAAQVVSDRKVRHRVLHLLAGMPDPAIDDTPWRRFLSSRGEARRLWAHPGVLDRLAADPKVSSGGTGAALAGLDGLTAGAKQLELYVRDAEVDEVIHRYRMREDRNGPVNLVIVPSSVPADLAPRGGRPVPAPAAAADLLEEEDPRARHAGVAQLQASLRALQAAGWLDKATARSAHLEAGSQ
jgi:excisionase family DNA binding protein